MNYTYKKILEKHRHLNATPRKVLTKVFVYGFKAVIFLIIAAISIGGFAGLGVIQGIIANSPDVEDISIVPVGYQTTIYDCNGVLIETLEFSGSNRSPVSISQVPECLQWAFIDTEDVRFYEHNGIDLKGIVRAGLSFITTGSFSGGGASTITQQLLKNNVFENGGVESNNGALIRRKIQEQYLAIKLEQIATKDIILQNYMNTINLGSGCYGVQAAAKRYFNKDVSELNISESAVIAAITQNPTKWNPITFPENNAIRRKRILDNMFENKHITEEEYNEAINDDVYSRISQVNVEYQESETAYTYFVDELIDQLISDLQEEKGYSYTQAINAIYSGGLKIYSTQDSTIQAICDEEIANEANYPAGTSYSFDWKWSVKHADGTISNYSNTNITYFNKVLLGRNNFKILFDTQEKAQACIDEFKNEYLKEDDEILGETLIFSLQPQVSFTVIDQETGYVKAIVGGRGDKEASLSLNRATSTLRQPGSCFKILAAYAPALDRLNYTLASVEDDAPYTDVNGRPVSNWWNTETKEFYRGLSPFRQGIYQSMNIVAMKLITEITPQLGYEYLLDFGFSSLVEDTDQYIQSLALGGISKGVTNIELCAAYAAIANGGVYTEPVYYTKVLDYNGRILLESETETHRVLKETTSFLLTSAMHDVVTSVGTAPNANVTGQYIAGKTGTTSKANDLWFAGYSTHLTAVIWTGYDENSQISSNTEFHKKLWGKLMTRIHNELEYEKIGNANQYEIQWAKKLDSIVEVQVCKKSGKLPIEGLCDCDPEKSQIVTEYFAKGTEPTETCDCHVKYKICSVSGKLANEYCPDESCIEKVYRIRMRGTEGTTYDTVYEIPVTLLNSTCLKHREP